MILKNKKLIWIVLILVILFSLSSKDAGVVQGFSEDTDVNIYIFWGEGCPHCAEAKPELEEIAGADDRIGFYEFEVYEHQENLDLFFEMSEAYGVSPQGVPTMFIGDYSENVKVEIVNYINFCLESGCDDLGKAIISPTIPTETGTPQGSVSVTQEPTPAPESTSTPNDQSVVSPTPTLNGNSIGGESYTGGQSGKKLKLPFPAKNSSCR